MEISKLLTPIKTAIDSLAAIQSASVLRERIALLQDQMKLVEQVAAKAEKENAELAAKVVELENELSAYRVAQQFTEHRGALFKREASGRYVSAVYCPKCKTSTAAPFPDMPCYCGTCGWLSGFNGSEIGKLLVELEASA